MPSLYDEKLTCSLCHKRTDILAMRFNLAKDKLVCQQCFDKEAQGQHNGA